MENDNQRISGEERRDFQNAQKKETSEYLHQNEKDAGDNMQMERSRNQNSEEDFPEDQNRKWDTEKSREEDSNSSSKSS
jgi:hypothetical protein